MSKQAKKALENCLKMAEWFNSEQGRDAHAAAVCDAFPRADVGTLEAVINAAWRGHFALKMEQSRGRILKPLKPHFEALNKQTRKIESALNRNHLATEALTAKLGSEAINDLLAALGETTEKTADDIQNRLRDGINEAWGNETTGRQKEIRASLILDIWRVLKPRRYGYREAARYIARFLSNIGALPPSADPADIAETIRQTMRNYDDMGR